MFGRPRCREWTPLATQQLRLRNLIQIVGYNIRPPEWCRQQCYFYITLHHTTMSAPFYTSEKITSPHPKWKEIDSEITQRMSSTNVVIRIWCHIVQPRSPEETDKPQDTIIQTWGVYFSGLRYIGANLASNFTSDCFKSNTLVFQMHGGYFCSYNSLKLDIIPPENETEQGSLSSDSSGKTNLSRITLEPRFIRCHKQAKEARSISPGKYSKRIDKEYSKSHSPIERGFKQSFPTLRTSASLNIGNSQRDQYRRREHSSERKRPETNHIYEHSPDSLDVKEFTTTDLHCDTSKNASQEELSASRIDLSETAENYDLRNESYGAPKYRYMALSFLKSEIRPSYNSDKLRISHYVQYSIKKKQEAVQEIKERIYKKSALPDCCLEDQFDILKCRSRSQRSLFSPEEDVKVKCSSHTDLNVKNGRIKEDKPPVSNGPRLTLKLNDLLSLKSKPSPFQRAEHVRLTRQLEILRFKRIILSDERDGKLANIRRLKERHTRLCEENQDVGLDLMQKYHTLSRRNEDLKETRQTCGALRELAARAHGSLVSRRSELLMQLHQIFHIEQREASGWSIVGVPLPVSGEEGRGGAGGVGEAAAAGLAAQALCVAAAILQRPLRYKITLLGSATKILDFNPDLPDPNIPLFARGGDSTMFHYGMFLLNKCIAQLIWIRALPLSDIRPTLANLQRLMLTPDTVSDSSKLFGTYKWLAENHCPRTQSLRSLVASERGKYRQFNRFKDAVDGQSPESVLLRRHRHSRSVGSYNDDQEIPLDASTTSIMGSEPNIYNAKLNNQVTNTEASTLKSHNSDSEILRLAQERDEKVLFTLGDDAPEVAPEVASFSQKLVKISTNNDDSVTNFEDVKQICTEISEFCNEKTESFVQEAFDVVQHMEEVNENITRLLEIKTSKDIEEVPVISCDNCENNLDGVCDIVCANTVSDVIVIPSDEAMLNSDSANSEQTYNSDN